MFKVYCDGCGKELERDYVSTRAKGGRLFGSHLVEVEIMVGTGQPKAITWNQGNICGPCLVVVLDHVLACERAELAKREKVTV